MDASCSHPPDSNLTGSTASRFLANLPSRGFFSSTVSSSNPVKDFTQGGMRVYVCQHDTTPPEGQHIKTNQTNILIRSLQLKKQKSDSSSKDVKGTSVTEGSRKRSGGRLLDDRASTKKSNNSAGSLTVGSDNRTSDKEYYSLTVERLRALLKERGLSPKGRKDELVARWRSANG